MKNFQIDEKIDEVKFTFNRSLDRAREMFKDPSKIRIIADEALAKGERSSRVIQPAWQYLQTFYQMLIDYLNGSYTSIKSEDLIKILGAFIYFVTPIDVFPDFIPAFGFLDDIFVLGLVAASTNETIIRYRAAKTASMAAQ